MTETEETAIRVEAIEVPAVVRGLTEIEPIGYEDAFRVTPAPEAWRPAEAAARAMLGEAPPKLRAALLAGWSGLGLRLEGSAGREILGWRLRRSDEEVAVFAADSPLGIAAELVFSRREDTLIYATLVHLGSGSARDAWAEIEPFHQPMVRRLLERAAGTTA